MLLVLHPLGWPHAQYFYCVERQLTTLTKPVTLLASAAA